MMKIKSKGFLKIVLTLVLIYFVWSTYPVQWVSMLYLQMSNVRMHEFYEPLVKRLPNWYLLFALDDVNPFFANEAKSRLCIRGQHPAYFERVKKLTSHRLYEVRTRAFGVLQCTDKQKAIEFYYDKLNKLDATDDQYRQALGILLTNYKTKEVYPYLIKYAQAPDGWKNASCVYLEEYGDPAALPVLYELRDKAQGIQDPQVKFELKRIEKAIAALEALKTQQETKNVLPAPAP